MKLTYKASERWVFGGKTGSGKSEFAKFLLRPVSDKMPVAIVDIKNLWLGENPEWEKKKSNPGTIDKPHLVTKFNPKLRVQVIQPIKYDDILAKFLLDILKQKRVHLHIDDTAGLCTATQVPDELNRVWTQGRALQIGASVCTQMYNRIPIIFKTQAEKFAVFRVGREDEKDFANMLNVDVEEVTQLGQYEYIFYDNTSMDSGLWFPPLKLEKPKETDKEEKGIL